MRSEVGKISSMISRAQFPLSAESIGIIDAEDVQSL